MTQTRIEIVDHVKSAGRCSQRVADAIVEMAHVNLYGADPRYRVEAVEREAWRIWEGPTPAEERAITRLATTDAGDDELLWGDELVVA